LSLHDALPIFIPISEFLRLRVFFLNIEWDNIGTIVIATNNDAAKAKVTAKAKGINNSPTGPVTKARGEKTAIVTMVEERIGVSICLVASLIKAPPDSFSSDKFIRLCIFSITTIESSTTRPIATVNESIVIIFNDISICFKISNAMSKDKGIDITEINVERILRKNNKIIITANKAPSKALDTMVSTDCSIGSA